MTRRPGLTLTEVLVTLAILAFGILAILTLFPLAASQMAIAVREDRSAQAAAAADGYMRAYWKGEVESGFGEAFSQAMDDPDGPNPAPPGAPNNPPAKANEVGFPVVVDPMGFVARSGVDRNWIGEPNPGTPPTPNTFIPRRNLSKISSSTQAFRTCSLMDGFGYDDDGRPVVPGSGGIADRELRYNFLWVLQRPVTSNKSTASLTVVVFDNRPHLFAPAGAEGVFTGVSFDPVNSPTTVTVAGVPDVKPGGWVMDATVTTVNPVGAAAGAPPIPIRNANFYQVVSVTGTGPTTLELQTPLKQVNKQVPLPYTGTLVVLKGVSGVYTKPQLTGE